MSEIDKMLDLGKLIRSAGGRPNHRYYRAMRALRQLDLLGRKPLKGKTYWVVMPNGKETKIFVPDGGDIYKEAKARDIEIFSFGVDNS